MSSIRLGQLFTCTEHGGSLVAEAADGQLLHIDEVPSGLACNCTCPGCGRRMVAKKGDVQAHHFAHHAQQDGRTCMSAGETALHKFAKRILNERLEIALPAMTIDKDGDSEAVVQAERRSFDRAILETRDGQIVPDVVLLLRDRRLIVEFKVTHPCDENKIERIRVMDIGAIEVDLSQYREYPLNEIGDRILYGAPRIWLHNPRERQARERLEDRARRRDEEKKKQVEHFRSAYRHRSPSKKIGNGACETTARNDGFGDLINLSVDGAGCFTVSVAEWQAAVLLMLVGGAVRPFRTRNGLAGLRAKGWIDRTFADMPDEVASVVSQAGIPFGSPIRAVEAYLRQLERGGFIHSGHTETWRVSEALRTRIEDIRELRERPGKRMADIRDLVGKMIAAVAEEETASFAFDHWWTAVLPERDYAPRRAADFDEGQWQSFRLELSNITTQIRFSPRPKLDLMGLPFDAELSRAVEQKRREEEERERARQAKLEADRTARLDNMRNRAVRQLGDEAKAWLVTPNSMIEGQSPLDAAARNEAGCDAAILALDRRIREIAMQRQAAERKAEAVAKLEAVAQSRYYDPDRAALWMRGKRQELSGRSPEEFAVDDATLQRCMELLPAKRSRH